MRKNLREKIFILAIALTCAVFLGIAIGACDIPLSELFLESARPILHVRALRVLLALIVGSALSAAGAALQAILRNPLAEPYLLGTSSGAGLGAVAGVVLGIGAAYLPFAAFLGAILSFVLVYNLAKEGNKVPVQSLILSGVIASIALSGIMVFLIYISDNEALHGAMWWLWGSMQVYDAKFVYAVGIIVMAGILALHLFSQDLNAISIGEEEAVHLGISTEKVKKIIFLITSFITASIVSVCGIIGFVGLVIPHITRLIFGPDHRVMLTSSALAGALFMVICDMLSRSLIPPMEIPIGIITAIIGAPVFVILVKTKQGLR